MPKDKENALLSIDRGMATPSGGVAIDSGGSPMRASPPTVIDQGESSTIANVASIDHGAGSVMADIAGIDRGGEAVIGDVLIDRGEGSAPSDIVGIDRGAGTMPGEAIIDRGEGSMLADIGIDRGESSVMPEARPQFEAMKQTYGGDFMSNRAVPLANSLNSFMSEPNNFTPVSYGRRNRLYSGGFASVSYNGRRRRWT